MFSEELRPLSELHGTEMFMLVLFERVDHLAKSEILPVTRRCLNYRKGPRV